MIDMTDEEILRAMENGVRRAVREALRDHKRAGRSIVIWRDGKVVELPPEEIPDYEDDAPTPASLQAPKDKP